MRYRYAAYDRSGASVAGALAAASPEEALRRLAAQGLTAASIVCEDAPPAPQAWWRRDIRLGAGSAPPAALARVCRAIAVMLRTGVPLSRAVALAGESLRGPTPLRRALDRIASQIAGGGSLGAAMRLEGALFPRALLAAAEAGERSNALGLALSRAGDALERHAALRRDLRAALLYPTLLLLVGVAITALLMFTIVPAIEPLFRAAGVAPPPLIAGLAAVAGFIRSYGLAILLAVIAVSVAVAARLAEPRTRETVALAIERTPILGRLVAQRRLAELLGAMAMLLESGATLTAALSSLAESRPIGVAGRLVDKSLDAVRRGAAIAAVWRAETGIAAELAEAIGIAEQSNRWTELLSLQAMMLEADVRAASDAAARSITPIATVVLGGLIGSLVVSTIGAILDLNDIALR